MPDILAQTQTIVENSVVDVIINSTTNPPPDKPVLNTEYDWQLNVLKCLGYPTDKLPLASLLSHCYHLEGDYLVASPIFWQATHNDAIISIADDSLLTEEQALYWFNKVNQFLEEIDLSLVYHNKTTWLVKLAQQPAISSKPVMQIINQSLMPFLQALDPQLFWQKLVTELQMFFTAEAFNENLPINGLWFYGEGHFNINPKQAIFTDYPLFYNEFPEQFQRLSPSSQISRDAIILIKDYEKIDYLTPCLKGHSINWYWNNCAYHEKLSWWTKILQGFNR